MKVAWPDDGLEVYLSKSASAARVNLTEPAWGPAASADEGLAASGNATASAAQRSAVVRKSRLA
jgi:hypothetical protein